MPSPPPGSRGRSSPNSSAHPLWPPMPLFDRRRAARRIGNDDSLAPAQRQARRGVVRSRAQLNRAFVGLALGCPLLAKCGAGRRASRRRPGVRPHAGYLSPRHQTVKPTARRSGDRLGRRFRVGQSGRGRQPDEYRRHRGDDSLHGAGAVPWAVRRPVGRVRPGLDFVRDGGAPAGIRSSGPAGAHSPGDGGRAAPAAED